MLAFCDISSNHFDLQVLPQSRSISKLVSLAGQKLFLFINFPSQVNKLALPYLMYLARTQPDISTQAMVGASCLSTFTMYLLFLFFGPVSCNYIMNLYFCG